MSETFRELFEIDLDELSLVDNPANQYAKATLYKRYKEENENMTETVEKAVFDAAKTENEKLRKYLLDEGYKITKDGIEKKVEKKEEMIEINGESFAKSAIPAPMLKAYEEAIAEKAEAAFEKSAKEALPNVPVGFAKALLKTFEKDAEIMEFVKSLDAMFEDQTKEVGKNDSEDAGKDPAVILNDMAKKYQSDNGVTFHKAYAEVVKTQTGQDLINKIYKEKN